MVPYFQSLSPTNREFVDRKLAALKVELDQVKDQLGEVDARAGRKMSPDAVVAEALKSIREFEGVFEEGTLAEKKELVSLMVERVDVDPVGKTARCYIREFPAPSLLDTGNLLGW
jgi:hypothetical protein